MKPDKQTYKPWHGYLLIVVIVVALGLKAVDVARGWLRPDVPTADVPAVMYEEVVDEAAEVEEVDEIANEVGRLPEENPSTSEPLNPSRASYNLALPWLSQAPFGVWDAMHEETCEEASFVMVALYYQGGGSDIDPKQGDAELYKLVAYEEERGYDVSMTAAEAVEVIEGYYADMDATVIEDPTVEDLKAYIDAGRPVIVPAAGRELGNPFFSGEGPVYHMLVLRGYTEDTFITNDPGTRHGKNYSYAIDVFMDAIGDWEGHDPANGPKRVILMKPANVE